MKNIMVYFCIFIFNSSCWALCQNINNSKELYALLREKGDVILRYNINELVCELNEEQIKKVLWLDTLIVYSPTFCGDGEFLGKDTDKLGVYLIFKTDKSYGAFFKPYDMEKKAEEIKNISNLFALFPKDNPQLMLEYEENWHKTYFPLTYYQGVFCERLAFYIHFQPQFSFNLVHLFKHSHKGGEAFGYPMKGPVDVLKLENYKHLLNLFSPFRKFVFGQKKLPNNGVVPK